MTINEALTAGDLCRRLGEPRHRIDHVLSSRGIKPVGRCGRYRLFSLDQLEYIRRELARIDRDRGLAIA